MRQRICYLLDPRQPVDNTLVFLHIPKCAGKTLKHIIYGQYPYGLQTAPLVPFSPSNYNLSIDADLRKHIRVLTGHFILGAEQPWLDPTVDKTYITMLREPFDRVMSAFYYARRHELVDGYWNERSFKEFIINKGTGNIMTECLSGDPDNIELALANLRKFDHVGIVEEFNRSVETLATALDWNVESLPKENATPDRPKVEDLSEEEVATLIAKNQNDIRLYQEAVQLSAGRS